MSTLVAVLAWAAVAGWGVSAVLLMLAHWRLKALERAHTSQKWDLLTVRAELGALRRRQGSGTAGVDAPGTRPRTGVRGEDAPGEDTVVRSTGGGPARVTRAAPTPGATAWRRAHRRPSGRRRRPS